MSGVISNPLDPQAADRLAKLCGLFGSAHDGERASAALKANALVRSLGLTWRDVIGVAQPADWRMMAQACVKHLHKLDERELSFIVNMGARLGDPTPRQLDWLTAIYNRVTQ